MVICEKQEIQGMKLKNLLMKASGVIVSFAWAAVILSANTTCAFCTFEEKAPANLKDFYEARSFGCCG